MVRWAGRQADGQTGGSVGDQTGGRLANSGVRKTNKANKMTEKEKRNMCLITIA